MDDTLVSKCGFADSGFERTKQSKFSMTTVANFTTTAGAGTQVVFAFCELAVWMCQPRAHARGLAQGIAFCAKSYSGACDQVSSSEEPQLCFFEQGLFLK